MGVVYLARRADGLYERLVALKVARAPVFNPSLRGRFLAERDILAGLAHPNIAPLYDAGVTDDGLPYFTMEYVDGVTIEAYCDRQSLDLRARIRLFLRVCDAVAAAHRALVVHRDLKPTNVLVTADGDVKLLDFGIAKLLERDSPSASIDTATDARLMTPAYASPEQVMGRPVSTGTDVYALGLLLYELLSGRRAHRFTSSGLGELARVVAETDPMPMSEALAQPPADATSPAEVIARSRGTTPGRLARQLRGDLERIAGMALRRDPEKRYASAAHLAEDLDRYLDGRPVVARGHSLAYRASRFVRRHRVVVVAVSIGVLSMVGHSVLTFRHARELAVAAERERQDAVRAREVADFVVGLFEVADLDIVQKSGMPIAQMLEQGLSKANALSAQPQLQARLLNAIGRVYFNLGRYREAEGVATRALALSRQAEGDQHPDVARDHRLLGLVTGQLGRPREAAEMFGTALKIHQRVAVHRLKPPPICTTLLYELARSGRLDEAEQQVTASLTAHRELLPPDHEDLVASLSTLAFVRSRHGRPREAVDLYREALGIAVKRLGDRHPEVARTRQNLATVLSDAGSTTSPRRR